MSFGGNSGSSSSIHSGTDVALNNPADGQVLTYSGSLGKWQNKTSATSSSAPQVTSVPYSGTVTPNASTTDLLEIGALTGTLILATPIGNPADGQILRINFMQDSTGGRSISFSSGYAFGSDVTTSLLPTAGNAEWVMLFAYNAADSKWRALAIARGF